MYGSVYSFSMRFSVHLFSIHTIAMVCVNHKEQSEFPVVLAPLQTDLFLYTDVLHHEANVLLLHTHGVISYHRFRATDSVRLLSSNRYTKQRAPEQASLSFYLYVMQLSTSLYVPIDGKVVTASPSLSLYRIAVNTTFQDGLYDVYLLLAEEAFKHARESHTHDW